MEENILDQHTNSNLNLSGTMVSHLYETAKWAKLLAIAGFIFIGLILILAVFMGSIMGSMMGQMGGSSGLGGGLGAMVSVLYIGIGALYLYPTYKLYVFATKTKLGLDNNSQLDLDTGLGGLKSTFKFMGILTAIILGIYAIMLLFALIGGGAAMMMR